MRTKKAMLLGVILLLMVLLGACAAPAPTPAPTPEPTIPSHFVTYTEENLFSISYPPDWEPALSIMEDLEEVVKETLVSIEADAPVERASMVFFAGVPTEMGYMPNVNIVVESSPEIVWTHENVVEAQIQGMKKYVHDYREFSRTKTIIGGREATIVDLEGTFPRASKAHFLVMCTLVGKTAWSVTCTALPPEEFINYEQDFQAILKSLRILR
ncbi:hypothetical protein ES703_95813 [subsurface metagenome]